MHKKSAIKMLAPILVLFAVLIASTTVMAFQDPYPVSGTVTDGEGATIANATITVVNLETEEELEGATDGNGNYVVELINMPSGYNEGDEIEVTVTHGGLTGTGITTIDTSKDTPGSKVDLVLGEDSGVASIFGQWWFWLLIIVVIGLVLVGLFVLFRAPEDD